MDFSAVFDRLPTPFMILDRDLRYAGMNEAYLKVTGRTRESIMGRHVFDAFPAEGESRRMLEDSLFRARDTGQTDVIPYIAYAIPRPKELGGGFEERVWSVSHTPVPDETGRTAFLVQHTQDITHFQQLKRLALGPQEDDRALEMDMLERARSVQAENERLRQLMMQAPGFMAVLSGPDHVYELVNAAYLQLTGRRNLVGLPVRDALPEIGSQGYLELLDRVRDTGVAFVGRSMSLVLQREPGGPVDERYVDFVFQPILDADGEVGGIFIEGSDITDRVRAQGQQKLLIDELNHRVKNTLSTVQAIAMQTLRSEATPAVFVDGFQARLGALAHAHDLLTRTHWAGVDLESLLRHLVSPYSAERIKLDGPPVQLTPRVGLALVLVLHELATNAAKYGGLSRDGGQVSVTWSVDADNRLRLDWREADGPPVVEPARTGFGSRLIKRSVEGELAGSLAMDYNPEGLHSRIIIPLTEPAT